MYLLHLPLTLTLPNKKSWALNLNLYRNTHYRSLNAYKRLFNLEVEPILKDLPVFNKITLTYRLYPKTRREMDIANVLTVVDKFFSDALVEFGKLPDDNYKHLTEISFSYGEVLPSNPHALVLINPLK